MLYKFVVSLHLLGCSQVITFNAPSSSPRDCMFVCLVINGRSPSRSFVRFVPSKRSICGGIGFKDGLHRQKIGDSYASDGDIGCSMG